MTSADQNETLEEERDRLRRERNALRDVLLNTWILVGSDSSATALLVRRALGPHVDTSQWTP